MEYGVIWHDSVLGRIRTRLFSNLQAAEDFADSIKDREYNTNIRIFHILTEVK